MGLRVKLIEDENLPVGQPDKIIQDLVLTVHHCYMHVLMNSPAFNIIENHLGAGMTKNQIRPA
jgi:hypothetical protein